MCIDLIPILVDYFNINNFEKGVGAVLSFFTSKIFLTLISIKIYLSINMFKRVLAI